jgi:hypothetical protein
VHPVLASLDNVAEGWIESLDSCAADWEKRIQAEIKVVIALTRSWIGEALDAKGFGHARQVIKVLARRLAEWAGGAEQRALDLRDELSQMATDAQDALDDLVALLDKLPERRFWDLVRLLRRPTHWVQLSLRWRRLLHLSTRYLLLRAATLEMEVAIRQMEQACGVYWAAGSEIQTVARELDRLERDLGDRLGLDIEGPQWPDAQLLLGNEPQDVLEELERRYLPGPAAAAEAFLAEFGPLSEWWTSDLPSRETVAQWLEGRASPLADLSVWDVIRCRYPEPRDHRWWLEELSAQAVPLWRWDAASLSDDQRAGIGSLTLVLSGSGGSVGENPPWKILPLARNDGLGVVTLRWGIPATAQRMP